jgi:hypothetical protein
LCIANFRSGIGKQFGIRNEPTANIDDGRWVTASIHSNSIGYGTMFDRGAKLPGLVAQGPYMKTPTGMMNTGSENGKDFGDPVEGCAEFATKGLCGCSIRNFETDQDISWALCVTVPRFQKFLYFFWTIDNRCRYAQLHRSAYVIV